HPGEREAVDVHRRDDGEAGGWIGEGDGDPHLSGRFAGTRRGEPDDDAVAGGEGPGEPDDEWRGVVAVSAGAGVADVERQRGEHERVDAGGSVRGRVANGGRSADDAGDRAE